jgi:putative oxidoreductase
MVDLRSLIRPLLAAPFIVGGLNTLRAPRPTADADAVAPIAEAVGLRQDPETLAKVNAGVQVGAGMLLAVGFVPRLAALALSASLVPETVAGLRFWEKKDAAARNEQLAEFARSAGLLGGLLAAALDTGGRPSVFWSGRRAAERAAHNVADTVSSAYHALPVVT